MVFWKSVLSCSHADAQNPQFEGFRASATVNRTNSGVTPESQTNLDK